MAIVSEKQARVYQVPSLASLVASSSTNAKGHHHKDHHHHESHHHHFHIHHSGSQGERGSSIGSASKQDSSDSNTPSLWARFLTDKSNCLAKCQLSESSYARKSNAIQWRQPIEGESCLVSYLATGNLVVHSLPHLRPLHESDLVPDSCARISESMIFSRNGHCLYQPSAGEIIKFTISSQYKALINDMMGSLYVAREMPETPRANFFKSLFSAASSAATRQSERDELFGESGAGKGSKNVAKHISSLDKLKGAQAGIGSDLRAAFQGLDERGEKLGELEDRVLNMMNQADTYSQTAHQLAQKYKDKKWYQF